MQLVSVSDGSGQYHHQRWLGFLYLHSRGLMWRRFHQWASHQCCPLSSWPSSPPPPGTAPVSSPRSCRWWTTSHPSGWGPRRWSRWWLEIKGDGASLAEPGALSSRGAAFVGGGGDREEWAEKSYNQVYLINSHLLNCPLRGISLFHDLESSRW